MAGFQQQQNYKGFQKARGKNGKYKGTIEAV